MLYTLQSKDIIKQARTRLLELTDEVISSSAILEYLNLVHLEIQIKVLSDEMLEEVTNESVVSKELPVPEGFLAFYGKPVNQDKRPIVIKKRQDFLKAKDDENVITKKGDVFQVKGNSTNLTYLYYKAFDELGVNDTPQTHPLLHECYVEGIVYRARKDLQDPELAQVEKNSFEIMVQERASLVSQLQENSVEPVMFNDVQVI